MNRVMSDIWLRLASITMMVLLSQGCTLRELTYDYHPFCEVVLTVDWSMFDTGTESGSLQGMTAIFYPENGNAPIVEMTNDIHQAKVQLRSGRYNIIVYNKWDGGFEYIGFRNMERYETAEVYAVSTDTKWFGTKDPSAKVAAEPEQFAVATYEGFEVTEEMVEEDMKARAEAKANTNGTDDVKADFDTKSSISLTPHSIVVSGDVSIQVDGIQHLKAVRGSISGLAENVNLSTLSAGYNEVTHLLEEWTKSEDPSDYTKGFIRTNFDTFGHKGMLLSKAENAGLMSIPHTKADISDWKEVTLDVELGLKDNLTIIRKQFNVAEYVSIEGEVGKIVIDIDVEKKEPENEDEQAPVVLPEVDHVDEEEGGFDVDVGSWGEEEDIDIVI